MLILLLAAALRLYDLPGVPPELIADELDLYNSAQSIATTGRDVDGSLSPFFYSHLTRNPPIYGIAAYASSVAFGKNPWALRLPAVIFGLFAVVLAYAIAFELTGRRDVAAVTALLVATQPIFVHFSRIAWEPDSELPFLLGGLYVLVRSLTRTKREEPLRWAPLIGAAVLLGFASYTYMAAWCYAVVLGGALLLFDARRIVRSGSFGRVCVAIATWLAISAPALGVWFFDPLTRDRTHRISTFGTGFTLENLQTFLQNYAKHFSWGYLATTGDVITGATWRYLVGFGAFYWWVVPLAAFGVLALPRIVTAPWGRWWVWAWLAIYPLGGALTNEAIPNAPRTLAGAPVFCILAAAGACTLFDFARRTPKRARAAAPLVQAAFVCGVLASTALFARYYFTEYDHVYPNAWDSGTSELFGIVRAQAPHYRRVCFTIYPAFYAIDTYVRYYLSDVSLPKYENLAAPACLKPGTLLATDPSVPVPRDFVRIATIDDVNGLTFAIVSARPSV